MPGVGCVLNQWLIGTWKWLGRGSCLEQMHLDMALRQMSAAEDGSNSSQGVR